MASFDKVNYALRPNKNVERKIMLDVLHRLEPAFPIRDYRYIGMGSLWYEDFRLLHRAFGFGEMVSIEKSAVDRAEFNRPFDCVQVAEGESSKVLPHLHLRKGPSVVWLDHDKNLSGPAVNDALYTTSTVPRASVVAVSVNAYHGQIKGRRGPDDNELTPEEALREDVGPFVPPSLGKDDLNRKGFPALVSRILLAAFQHALVKAGREEEFVPLFNFVYSDGVTMVTVGGMIANQDDREALERIDWTHAPYVPNLAGGEPFRIDVPNLTLKEKQALDSCLPSGGLNPEMVKTRYGFTLAESKLEAYGQFYRQYPAFAEFVS